MRSFKLKSSFAGIATCIALCLVAFNAKARVYHSVDASGKEITVNIWRDEANLLMNLDGQRIEFDKFGSATKLPSGLIAMESKNASTQLVIDWPAREFYYVDENADPGYKFQIKSRR